MRYNSYFIWLEKALQNIYDFDEPITAENWDTISKRIKEANINDNYHLEILKKKCRYEKIVLDTYWNPGSNNNNPDLFTPTFRIDMFVHGYKPGFSDMNGNMPDTYFGKSIDDIDEYTDSLYKVIADKKSAGCVALKCALAYERSLDFNEVPKEKAQRAMTLSEDKLTSEDIKAFGDYVFYKICGIAGVLEMPFQCHVGLGQLKGTNAMQMNEVIDKNRLTKFVLFHGGCPWLDDVLGLAHNYSNVYPDLCWLPLISTSSAVRMLTEFIEVSTVDRICWGCDTWTSEESVGALMAIKNVLASALSKMVCDNYFSVNSAKKIIQNVLYKNAKVLYKL